MQEEGITGNKNKGKRRHDEKMHCFGGERRVCTLE